MKFHFFYFYFIIFALSMLHSFFPEAKNLLENADRVLILSHRSPDGDTIGSNLALRRMLERLGKKIVSACIDPISAMYRIFPATDLFVQDFNEKDFDLFVNVDASSVDQLVFPKLKPFLVEAVIPMINFDHHISNTLFGTHNIILPDACSATFILQHFFEFCSWPLTPEIATYLLLGHYYDTGNFMHSNATEEVFRAASCLLQNGADLSPVLRCLHCHTSAQLHLWGHVLENATRTDDVVIGTVSGSDLKSFGVSTDQVSGVVDYLNTVSGARSCLLFSEDLSKAIIKCSTRTRRDDVDLASFCRKYGGGGHRKAAGFRLDGVLSWEEYFCIDSPEESSV